MTTDELKRNGWIDVNEQRPPLAAETPQTAGFFLLLEHDPKYDAIEQYRMLIWFGTVSAAARFWHPLPAYK